MSAVSTLRFVSDAAGLSGGVGFACVEAGTRSLSGFAGGAGLVGA
ncbi:hypothetical protein [Bradyrhizobium sp. SZCCHNS30591]|nr:hypothetical protein [Bradyrhizobium sp. SZCCHNS30591]